MSEQPNSVADWCSIYAEKIRSNYRREIADRDVTIAQLWVDQRRLVEYRELLEDAARQWGIAVTRDGKPGLSTGGLSTLEDIFAALGWDDPHMLTEPYTDPNQIAPDTYAISGTGDQGKG